MKKGFITSILANSLKISVIKLSEISSTSVTDNVLRIGPESMAKKKQIENTPTKAFYLIDVVITHYGPSSTVSMFISNQMIISYVTSSTLDQIGLYLTH